MQHHICYVDTIFFFHERRFDLYVTSFIYRNFITKEIRHRFIGDLNSLQKNKYNLFAKDSFEMLYIDNWLIMIFSFNSVSVKFSISIL